MRGSFERTLTGIANPFPAGIGNGESGTLRGIQNRFIRGAIESNFASCDADV
jgi:hypothetical protein